MDTNRRKISPSSPSFSLEKAIAKAGQIYDQESIHAAPVDTVAKAIGYKNSTNGAAMRTLATLKMFGLIEKVGTRKVAISKQFQHYRLAPEASIKSG